MKQYHGTAKGLHEAKGALNKRENSLALETAKWGDVLDTGTWEKILENKTVVCFDVETWPVWLSIREHEKAKTLMLKCGYDEDNWMEGLRKLHSRAWTMVYQVSGWKIDKNGVCHSSFKRNFNIPVAMYAQPVHGAGMGAVKKMQKAVSSYDDQPDVQRELQETINKIERVKRLRFGKDTRTKEEKKELVKEYDELVNNYPRWISDEWGNPLVAGKGTTVESVQKWGEKGKVDCANMVDEAVKDAPMGNREDVVFVWCTYAGTSIDWKTIRVPNPGDMLVELTTLIQFKVLIRFSERFQEEGMEMKVTKQMLKESLFVQNPKLQEAWEMLCKPTEEQKRKLVAHESDQDAMMTAKIWEICWAFRRKHKEEFDQHSVIKISADVYYDLVRRCFNEDGDLILKNDKEDVGSLSHKVMKQYCYLICGDAHDSMCFSKRGKQVRGAARRVHVGW